jgi:hypothetical protein
MNCIDPCSADSSGVRHGETFGKVGQVAGTEGGIWGWQWQIAVGVESVVGVEIAVGKEETVGNPTIEDAGAVVSKMLAVGIVAGAERMCTPDVVPTVGVPIVCTVVPTTVGVAVETVVPVV